MCYIKPIRLGHKKAFNLATHTKIQALFESLASMSVPLERTFHIALTEIQNDKSISEKRKKKLLGSVKALLFNSLELHTYIGNIDSNFDIKSDGISEYNKIRNDYKNAFPNKNDEDINLHEHIEKLSY